MDQPFDPYQKWLGKPEAECHASLYALLGLQLFEADEDVIANAADQRIVFVRQQATGANKAVAKQIVGELVAAQRCLLNAATKAQYDAGLRHASAKPEIKAPVPPPPRASQAEAARAPAVVVARTSRRVRSRFSGFWIVGSIAIALAVGGVTVALLRRPQDRFTAQARDEVAQSEGENESGKGEAGQVPAKASERPGDGAQGPASAAVKAPPEKPPPGADPKAPPGPGNGSTEPTAQHPDPSAGEGPGSEPRSREEEPSQVEDAPPAEPPSDEWPQPGDAASPKPDALPKRKPPAPEVQAELERQVRDVYDFATAKTLAEKCALAKQLVESPAAREGPDEAFVLHRLACQLAAEAGDVEQVATWRAWIEQTYDADVMNLEIDAMMALGRALDRKGRDPEANEEFRASAQQLLDEALREDRYGPAKRLVELVLVPATRRTRDRDMIRDATRLLNQVKQREQEYKSVQDALAALSQAPDDAEANLTAGRWYCLMKGRWVKGLPHLAKGKDPALAEIARRDVANPTGAADRAGVGDGWWDLASSPACSRDPDAKQRCLERAMHWYKEALPGLDGQVKDRVEQRIADIDPKNKEPVLVFDGVRSCVLVPGLVYDGTRPITIEAFVIPASIDKRMTVVGWGGDGYEGGVALCSDDDWEFRAASGSGSSIYDHHRPAPGRRVHVALSCVEGRVAVYADGQIVRRSRAQGPLRTFPLPLCVGATLRQRPTSRIPETREHFHGVIESVRVSDGARYTGESYGVPESLDLDQSTIALCRFDQGLGDVVPDLAKKARKAKIVRATWTTRGTWKRYLASKPAAPDVGYEWHPLQ